MNNPSRLTGVAIAAAAATLFIAGCASQGGMQTADSGAVKVKCYGANACKGHGFKALDAKGCLMKGGTIGDIGAK